MALSVDSGVGNTNSYKTNETNQTNKTSNGETVRSQSVTTAVAEVQSADSKKGEVNYRAQSVAFQLAQKVPAKNSLASDEAVNKSAEKVIKDSEYDYDKGAQTLINEVNSLKAKYGDEATAKLIQRLNSEDKNGNIDLTGILRFASNKITNAEITYTDQAIRNATDHKNLADAIGGAYQQMSSTEKSEFVQRLTDTTQADGLLGHHLTQGKDVSLMADLVSPTSNTQLKKDLVDSFVNRATEIKSGFRGLNNGGGDIKNLYNSAAILAGSTSDKAAQISMFNSIVKSFPELASDEAQQNSVFGDKTFKDRMSQLFLNNAKDILGSQTSENGRFPDAQTYDGMVKFFEMSLFSKDGGKIRDSVKGETIKLMTDLAQGQGLKGRTQTANAYLAGNLLGMLQSGAINQKEFIENDEKSKNETAKFFVGIGFSFVPGAGKILGEGANKVLEIAYDKAKEFAQSKAESELGKFINGAENKDALKDVKNLFYEIRDLRFAITGEVLKNREDLASNFSDGYTDSGVDDYLKRTFGK